MTSVGLVYLNKSKTIHMGLAYISAVLKQHGHIVTLYDTAFMSDTEITGDINFSDIKIVMFSVHSIEYQHALRLSNDIKKLNPSIYILWGGWHVLVDPDGSINNECVDMVCVGEGEYAALDVVDNVDRLGHVSDIPNIWFKRDGEVIRNPVRPLGDLDALPFPDREIFNRDCLEDRNGLFHFSTMRGCPFQCSFCCNYKMLELYKAAGCNYIRTRSIDSVIEEMMYLVLKYSPREFFFTDEMFLNDYEHVREFCRKYKENHVGVPFGFMARPERVTDEILCVLKDAGCVRIHMGIESGNEELRKRYLNRHMSNDVIIRAFDLCKKHGILTASFNMIGLPFETKDTINDTFMLNKRCSPTVFQITILYPFIGTKIRELYRVNGLLDEAKESLEMSNSYYDSYITRNDAVSFSYLKHQQVFMNLFFNYSEFFARVSLFLPSCLLRVYGFGVSWLCRLSRGMLK